MRMPKLSDTLVVCAMLVVGVLFNVGIWWAGPASHGWALFVQILLGVLAFVPAVMWLVHGLRWTNMTGWQYHTGDVWEKYIHYSGHTLVAHVQRKPRRHSYYVAFLVDDPFVDGDLYVVREYKDFGDLTPVLDEATVEAVATLVEWMGHKSKEDAEALYRSYY